MMHGHEKSDSQRRLSPCPRAPVRHMRFALARGYALAVPFALSIST